ncbi:proteoglycan 4-like [Durio zibethinus]|uniref:Proteoglycan 4-like n=1 Tax=Durio zibethinus TaxID=66656 RepID=A0A6P6AVT0_DURZI|nr:proteoglycan 4-like [Durio zibethinus]
MGDQRQRFRFRLPWLSSAITPRPASPPRPAAEPQPRPAAPTQAPAQSATTIPIRRPPFRPAGITPVQTTPTQSQAAAPKTETQPAAPSRAVTESKATSQPASPSRLTNQIRASSVPPSPSRRATETQVTSQPVPPFRGTIQSQAASQTRPPSPVPTQARAASVPPSPPRIASQPQSTVQAVSKQQSPSRLASQPAGQTSAEPSARPEGSQPPTSTQPPSSASQETTFQPFGVAVKPSQATAEVKEVAPITAAAIETPSAPRMPKEREEREKVEEERKKGPTKSPTQEEPERRTKKRELLGAALETGKRHQEKQEDKKAWTITSTDEKQIKTVSSTHSKDGITPDNSHQKHVTSSWEQVPLHKEIREDISKFVHKLATGQPKLPTDEKSISVLTLAGENRGASFHMGSESTKKDGLVHTQRGYKANPDDSPDATTDGEGSSQGRKPKDSMTKENPSPRAYVNSNTQSINNSLVFESSVNGNDPGVHLEFLHNLAESTKSSAKAEPLETRRAAFNSTPAEKLKYEPTVRRRGRRGLFTEPSDSDPDNPEKPRRHGRR